jgi:hypothetical protein
MTTSATDIVIAAYNTLNEDERDEVFERIRERRVIDAAGTESDAARFVRSLRRVAEYVGHPDQTDLSVGVYKQASAELIAEGEDIETFGRLYGHYGSWPRAREALELSETTTVRRIEARFRYRQVGKVWRYSEPMMRDALARCIAYYATLEERDIPRGVSVAEFEHWRDRELELAQARGDREFHLPSSSPYRRRWKTWEAALLHFGYTPEQVAARLEPQMTSPAVGGDPGIPADLPVATLVDGGQPDGSVLSQMEAERVIKAYGALPVRSRYVLTTRLGLGMDVLGVRKVAEPLGLHETRIRQLQALTMDALVDAAMGPGRHDKGPRPGLRDDIVTALRILTSAR